MENLNDLLVKLYGSISEELYQKEVIDHCAQVGIVEYIPKLNINRYLVLHPDYYHPFQFEPHKLTFETIKKALQSFNSIARKYSLSSINDDHDYIENTKKLFKTLKQIEFEDPITADYFKELIEKRDKISFHADLPNYNKETNPPHRKNPEEWNFGSFLEYKLMHRSDAPIYANTFFSIESRIFAIAVFILGKKINKYDENCEKILNAFLKANNLTNRIEFIIEQTQNLHELKESLKNCKIEAEFMGLGQKIDEIISAVDSIIQNKSDETIKNKINSLWEILNSNKVFDRKDIEKY